MHNNTDAARSLVSLKCKNKTITGRTVIKPKNN